MYATLTSGKDQCFVRLRIPTGPSRKAALRESRKGRKRSDSEEKNFPVNKGGKAFTWLSTPSSGMRSTRHIACPRANILGKESDVP